MIPKFYVHVISKFISLQKHPDASAVSHATQQQPHIPQQPQEPPQATQPVCTLTFAETALKNMCGYYMEHVKNKELLYKTCGTVITYKR